jgi:predicted nucleic-acid-binding protein
VARRVMVESASLFVPMTVVLEFEWVMRGFYQASTEEFCLAIEHLLGMSHVTVERWESVADALNFHRRGLDFADALHWASSKACAGLVTFDDKGFARRAKRLSLTPEVVLAV